MEHLENEKLNKIEYMLYVLIGILLFLSAFYFYIYISKNNKDKDCLINDLLNKKECLNKQLQEVEKWNQITLTPLQ